LCVANVAKEDPYSAFDDNRCVLITLGFSKKGLGLKTKLLFERDFNTRPTLVHTLS
jgi:hypothetical protein